MNPITHIKAKGLKGQIIDEPLAQHQVYIGPNGSGKSSRAQAIALATMGYIPWGSSAKKPGDILKAYGPAEGPLTVAITCGGVELERRLSPTTSGATQRFRANQTNVGKDGFPVEMCRAGVPIIFDIAKSLIGISDAKKIDTLFSLFPPASDVDEIDDEIESIADKISATNKGISSLEGTTQRLSSSRQELNLPAGTLAEVRAEIEEASAQWTKTNEDIKAEEIRLAEIKATEDATAKAAADQKAKEEREAREKADAASKKAATETHQVAAATQPASIRTKAPTAPNVSGIIPTLDSSPDKTTPTYSVTPDSYPAESLRKVLTAMESSGCKVCAAKLVLKKELSSWSGK